MRRSGCGGIHDHGLCAGAPILVKIGALFGLGTVMLVMLLGQSRVFYSMSRDGLLWKWVGEDSSEVPYAMDLESGGVERLWRSCRRCCRSKN